MYRYLTITQGTNFEVFYMRGIVSEKMLFMIAKHQCYLA